MNWLEGIVLGLLQGITEILPVSSDGHLALLLHFWQISPSVRLNLTAALHLGTALAILIFMLPRIITLVRNLADTLPPVRNHARRLILIIIIGTLPALGAGLLLEPWVESLFVQKIVPSILFLINGTLLFTTRFARNRNRPIELPLGMLIGLIQSTAILPAISRSGTTISLALLLGVNTATAFEFSFLLALPVTLGAAIWELLKLDFSLLSPGPVISGIIVAGITGYLMLMILRRVIISRNFWWFGIYCWALGLLSLVLLR
ncbi:MAG: undecaprenyl-diphosphate phosphatase [candidate division WOR-3 bacterium]